MSVEGDPGGYEHDEARRRVRVVEEGFQAVGTGLGVRSEEVTGRKKSVREVVEGEVLSVLVGLGVV